MIVVCLTDSLLRDIFILVMKWYIINIIKKMIIELMEDYTSRVFFLSCGNTVEEKEKKKNQERKRIILSKTPSS